MLDHLGLPGRRAARGARAVLGASGLTSIGGGRCRPRRRDRARARRTLWWRGRALHGVAVTPACAGVDAAWRALQTTSTGSATSPSTAPTRRRRTLFNRW